MGKVSSENFLFLKEIPLGQGDRIVLVDEVSLEEGAKSRNVFRLTKAGEVVWQVDGHPEIGDSDYFTEVHLAANGEGDDEIEAFRVSGFEVFIELATGQIKKEEMVK